MGKFKEFINEANVKWNSPNIVKILFDLTTKYVKSIVAPMEKKTGEKAILGKPKWGDDFIEMQIKWGKLKKGKIVATWKTNMSKLQGDSPYAVDIEENSDAPNLTFGKKQDEQVIYDLILGN